MIGSGTIAGVGTTSRIGSIAGNGSFVGSAPLRKDEQAWDEQENVTFIDMAPSRQGWKRLRCWNQHQPWCRLHRWNRLQWLLP